MYRKIIIFNSILVFSTIVDLASTLTDGQQNLLRLFNRQCFEDSKVDPELVDQLKYGEFTNDEKLKEHVYCMSKKLALQDDAGIIQMYVLKAKLNAVLEDQNKTEELVMKCAQEKATPQESAYEALRCFHEQTCKI